MSSTYDTRYHSRSNSSDYRIQRGNDKGDRRRRGERTHHDEESYDEMTSYKSYGKTTKEDSESPKKIEAIYSDKRTREIYDDDENHLKVELGHSVITNKGKNIKYRADKMLGEGTFGKVFKCTNIST